MELEIKKKPRIPEDIRWRIIGWLESGGEQKAAAIFYEVDPGSISRIWKKFKETGAVKSKKRIGRPQVITEEKRVEVMENLLQHRVSLQETSSKLHISKTTCWRIAQDNELEFRKYGEMPNITEKASKQRLDFATNWLNKDLSGIIFTDESYFHIFRNTLGTWCHKGAKPVVKKLNPNKALMVWAAIASKGKSNLWIGKYGFKINSEEYCKMLNDTLVPFILANYQNGSYLVLQDNARCHTSKESSKWLIENQINILPNYPPYSPDFNAIEKMWKIMKDDIEKFQPQNLTELKDCILKSYEMISQEMINNWIQHVRACMNDCIEKKGY